MKLRILVEQKDIPGWPVVVEMWDKFGGHGSGGRMKREYHKQFTKAERRKCSQLHSRLYKWHLVWGFPEDGAVMKPQTLVLLHKLIYFAGTI